MAIKFNRSQPFATNGTVTAAGLHNLVDGLDIYQALITDQTALTTVGTGDKLLIADSDLTAADAPRSVTVQELFDDALTGGTFTNAQLSGNLTYGTATGNRTVSTSASITTGTINNATLGTTTGTAATFTSSTLGTTTATAANVTNGTIQTLTASTASISSGSASLSQGTVSTLNSTNGTITNLSTTLAGDFTISQGTGTIGTQFARLNQSQEYTRAHNFNATTLNSGTSIAWNLAENQVTRLVLSTNGTLSDPSNKVDGATYILIVSQGTGTNTLSFHSNYKWPGGNQPTLTSGSGKTDIFTFVSDGTYLFGATSKNYL